MQCTNIIVFKAGVKSLENEPLFQIWYSTVFFGGPCLFSDRAGRYASKSGSMLKCALNTETKVLHFIELHKYCYYLVKAVGINTEFKVNCSVTFFCQVVFGSFSWMVNLRTHIWVHI